MMHLRPRLAAAIVLLAGASALAHDFWIEPSSFRPAAKEEVSLALRVGERLAGEPVPRDNSRITRFVVAGPDGTTDVVGVDHDDPAGTAAGAKDGLYVVGYRSKRRHMELPAEKFETYLAEEGLEAVSKLRVERRETEAAGREVFSRCAKSLLWVGAGSSEGHDRVLGLTLELVPERNPYLEVNGVVMPFRLLYEGKPLAGALVVARCKSDPKNPVSARTDAEGRVKLKLADAGDWLVKAVHMIEAPKDAEADWESLWASVTFQLAETTK